MNKQQKKFYILLIILALVFTTKAFAALTFTNNTITGTNASTIDLGSGHDLYLQTSGGSVGIGTNSPGAKLDVNGDVNFGTTSGGTTFHLNGLFGTSYGYTFDDKAGPYLSIRSDYSSSTPVVVNTYGSVGIGTTSPAALLDVKGHVASSQTTLPTASVTGTGYSGASIVSGSTDTKGKITATVGANAGTLVVTFNSAYVTAPVCTTDANTATAQVDLAKMYSTTSTSALTLNFVASPTGGSETWSYLCVQ